MIIENRLSLLVVLALSFGLSATAEAKPKKEVVEEPPVMAGIELGRFLVRDLRPAEGIKVRLSFVLYAEVEEDLAGRTEKVIKSFRHRVRNEVLVALRMSEQHDFQEPGLETFRRRIFLRLRRVIPQLVFNRLLIGEYEYFSD